MTKLDSKTMLWASAIVVIVAAAGLSLYAVRALGDCSVRLKEYVAYSSEARELEKVTTGSASAIRMFEALPDPHPVSLADLMKKSLAGDKYEITEQTAQPAIQGWIAQRRDVTLQDIQLSKLAAFLADAEAARPPWRMISCRIISTGPEGGTGRVSLTFEALEKAQP